MAEMEYRSLGRSGLKVSVVGLGTNNFGSRMDDSAVERVVHACLDCGITLFDTADVYSRGRSEELLGAALKGRRDEAVIATKFFSPMAEGPYERGGSRRYVRRAVEASLRRLGTDYIDLYQMHAPDPDTPIGETLDVLNDLVHEGKVLYIGNSNFAGWQIADASWTARTSHLNPFVSAQNHWSLLQRSAEKDVIPACAHFGLGQLPYFPLAGGMLTGKYRRGETTPGDTRMGKSPQSAQRWLVDRNFEIVEKLERFAQDRGISLLEVAIGWLAAQSQVASVIAGATRVEQVEANVAAAAWRPSAEDLAEIDQIAPVA